MTNKTFFIHGHSVRQKDVPMAHHLAGLSYTATGYGIRIPTTHMVEYNGRWRRVYHCIYGNKMSTVTKAMTSGTLYIGKLSDNLIVMNY
mgnify:CR=1 FL=1